MEEKVSVIVTVYNAEPYLRRCLDSLAAQTHRNLEIIMVDDCSTDGSITIAKEYAEKYEWFRFIQRETNGGASATRNSGMKIATGEWLAFVDSDDWVTEDYISAMYEVAKKDRADIVMSSRYYYYPKTQKLVESSPFSDLRTESSQKEKIALSAPSATARLFRRQLVQASGILFPEDIWRSEETAAVIPWLTYANRISILPVPMYYYFQRPDSLSNKNSRNTDVSFYPKSIERMLRYSAPGFEKELEFRAISDLMYGMVMIMVRSRRSRSEIIREINRFEDGYSHWRKNPYLDRLPQGKRIFILCAGKRLVFLLRVFVSLWDVVGFKIKTLRRARKGKKED